jgi:hypothetical protein
MEVEDVVLPVSLFEVRGTYLAYGHRITYYNLV